MKKANPIECPKVFYRIIPHPDVSWDYIKILDNNQTVYVRTLQDLSAKTTKKLPPQFWLFETDGVFYNDTQNDIYNVTTAPILHKVASGGNVVVLAFGQTGSGKTSTISGLQFNYEHRGILPRAITNLFNLQEKVNAARNNRFKTCICMSYIELHKNVITDLLRPTPNHVKLDRGIQKIKVKDEDEALRLIFTAEGRKETVANCTEYYANANSSICTFYFYTKDTSFHKPLCTEGKLHIIDLAGVDSMGNASCLFKDALDVGSANLAKSQLEQFFLVLAKNIPYQSKIGQNINVMLQFLGDSLNDATVLRLIGHIKTSRNDLMITLSVLRFGQFVKRKTPNKNCPVRVKSAPVAYKDDNDDEEESKKSKLEDISSFLPEFDQNLSTSLNDERIRHVERTLNEFLQNKISKVALLNVCDPSTALEVLKKMCKVSHGSNSSVGKAHSSTKQATSSNNMLKKRSFDKRSTSSKHSNGKKGSASSLLRKTSNSSKKRSNSSVGSLRNNSEKIRSSNKSMLMIPDLIPEFKDAWGAYMAEKVGNYNHFVEMYRQNEEMARKVYKNYLDEMQTLKQIEDQLENAKETLILARFTNDLQENHANSSRLSACVEEHLAHFKELWLQQQEKVLELQTEMKLHIGRSKDIKNEMKEDFEEFCKEKFLLPVNDAEEADKIFNMENVFEVTEEEMQQQEDETNELRKMQTFEHYKTLMFQSRRETNAIKEAKKREWVGYL